MTSEPPTLNRNGTGRGLKVVTRPLPKKRGVSAAPEVIVTTTQGIEASGGLEKFWSRPGLELTPAYRQRSLVALDALYLIGFGPRLPQAVAELHRFSLKVAA